MVNAINSTISLCGIFFTANSQSYIQTFPLDRMPAFLGLKSLWITQIGRVLFDVSSVMSVRKSFSLLNYWKKRRGFGGILSPKKIKLKNPPACGLLFFFFFSGQSQRAQDTWERHPPTKIPYVRQRVARGGPGACPRSVFLALSEIEYTVTRIPESPEFQMTWIEERD